MFSSEKFEDGDNRGARCAFGQEEAAAGAGSGGSNGDEGSERHGVGRTENEVEESGA